jgi:transposase
MSYEKDADYNARWLFPPSLEELLPADHPARMVREFVEAQDLKALGFTTRTADEGRPNYSAALMVKVWLYGYMSRIRSTRAVERACMESIGMLWLSGMWSPDHTTLWRFWRDNQKPLRQLFKQLLQIAAAFDLVGVVLHAVDGTKILSQASEAKGWHRGSLEKTLARLDEAIDEIMKQTEESAKQESAEGRLPESLQQRQELRSKVAEQLKRLDEKQRDHLNPGDEEARMMKCRVGTKFAYNAQAVVDQQSKLIVAADVVADESDNYQLVPMLEQVEANLSRVAEQTLADGGYEAATEFAKAEEKGYAVLVNVAEAKGPYDASRFTYDAEKDRCVCPRGEELTFDSVKARDKVEPYTVRVYRCHRYETCPVRWQCSQSQSGRTVQIHPNHAALKRQREKVQDEAMRACLKQRGSIIEALFGWSKEGFGFRRWTVRGLAKVKTQWLVLCTAMNLCRLHRQWAAGKILFRSASSH